MAKQKEVKSETKKPKKVAKSSSSDDKVVPVQLSNNLGNIIKSCRDIMRKDKGLNGDLDRLPQLTWIMFLKFLDDLEHQDEAKAELANKSFQASIPSPYRWRDWASSPTGMTGDEILSFINNDEAVLPNGKRGPGLFAKLRSLRGGVGRQLVISRVFEGTSNRMLNGYLVRDVLNKINGINFSSSDDLHTLGSLYEQMLREMRDAAGDSGEFYTPRPVIRFMINQINPVIGETILDPASGTGGFLVEAFEHLGKQIRTPSQHEIVQTKSLYGQEAKGLPYLLTEMNLLLHGVSVPNILLGNSLGVKLTEIGDSDRVDIIVTNPPFGGEEEAGIKANFPSDKQTSETALLFLQLIMRKLKRPIGKQKGGRAAVVVPNGILSGDGVCSRIKEELITNFNLHTIVRLPEGVFAPYTEIPSNLLFFDRTGKTEEIWYYEMKLPDGRRKYTKTIPIKYEEFSDCQKWWHSRSETDNAWKVKIEDIVTGAGESTHLNLDLKNPRTPDDLEKRNPTQIIGSLISNEKRIIALMEQVQSLLGERQ